MPMFLTIERLLFCVATVSLAAAMGGVAALASRLAGEFMIAREAAHCGAHALAALAAGFCGQRAIA